MFETGTVTTTQDIVFKPVWVKIADLDSPAFTGKPTFPTATFGDSDTTIANTVFVATAFAIARTYTP
ncbi:hypothetical protein [Cohnella lupini]|uniref:Uncharacterized protein n=1 Tax=Cohnella lupini TaxID=1294267 RepID=A0A3D9IT40_9BACL|nr:hypothetical protein [Cohnella lupini]RED64679.1 hypothetical protein DFP95_10299 [Cohnella lupini]